MAYLLLLLMIIPSYLFSQTLVSPYLSNPENILGYVDSAATFWINAHDPTYGGFYTDVDRMGNHLGTNKALLSQTRNAYGFVRAYMLTGNEQYLQMAEDALNFMYNHAWDNTYEGWFNLMTRDGTPINPNGTKTAFDQHYALLGISAYVEATDDSLSWQWLETGYTSLESHLWDSRPQYFGYYDHGNRSWSSVSGKSFNATVDALTTHLLYLYLMTENPGYLNRLLELGDNILNHLVASMDAQAIGFVERYDSDWNWDNSETMTIMGHVLKAAWSLARLYQLQPDTLYTQGASKLIEDVLLNGYDHEFGGPYKDFNRITGEMLMWGIPDTAKAWWQMEQAVTAGLQMYDITGDTLYLNMADETLDFFMHYFVDHTYGEVYADRTRYGDPIPQWGDNKGNGWKAGYHSIELGYYVYLYGKLFLHQQPVTLHYKFLPSSQERQIHLNPLAIAENELQIASVLKDGQTYGNFDPIQRILTIPPGTGGHFEVTYQRAPSFIAENNATFKPETFTLKQNYPNPFNPVTTIEFYLSHATHLTLHIYDVAGRKVKTLVNGYYPAGNYAVQWDATDAEGEKVSAGVYLYQMNSGNEAITRKMVLLK